MATLSVFAADLYDTTMVRGHSVYRDLADPDEGQLARLNEALARASAKLKLG